MAKRAKCWSQKIIKRNKATHYVADGAIWSGGSLCGRVKAFAFGEDSLPDKTPAERKFIKALEICDYCQAAARKK